MKNKFPITVRRGSLTVKIYHQPAVNVYTVAFYEGGQRQRPSFVDLNTARQEAHAVADRLARRGGNELVLKDGERLEYLRARDCLSPLHVPLDTAANEYAQAAMLLKGHASVLDAVRHYVATQVGQVVPIRAGALVNDLLQARAANHASDRHLQDLRCRLSRFAEAFQCEVHTIRPAQVQDFLLSLKLSPRSINNFRGALSNLFGHARLRGHAPKDFDPLAGIPPARETEGEVEVYTPDELLAMLARAEAAMIPYVVLAAFAGLRQAELTRLDWCDIRIDHIVIRGDIAKTRARRQVPLTPNLVAWLKPFRGQTGSVVPFRFVCDQLAKLTHRANLSPKRNGLRHAFGSYRVALLKDPATVAYEMGNTTGMVFRHYRRVVTEAEARRWFSIWPDPDRKPVFRSDPPAEATGLSEPA